MKYVNINLLSNDILSIVKNHLSLIKGKEKKFIEIICNITNETEKWWIRIIVCANETIAYTIDNNAWVSQNIQLFTTLSDYDTKLESNFFEKILQQEKKDYRDFIGIPPSYKINKGTISILDQGKIMFVET